MEGKIECELPNASIYNFEGIMKLKFDGNTSDIGLETDHMLLRGMSVRNTEKCYGLIIFTGHETKVMKNSEAAKYKMSKLEKVTNTTIALVFLL